jgi:UBX domain-containing protein 7
MDEAIATVVAVCSTTPEIAAQYAQLADGDPAQAVTLFYENGGADLAAASAPPPPAPAQTHGNHGNHDHPIDLDAEDEVADDDDDEVAGFPRSTKRRAADYEDDEAMARRLQNEMYGEGGTEEDIRAPIARQSEVLVGPGADMMQSMGAGAYPPSIEDRMAALARRRQQGEIEQSLVWPSS